LCWEAALLGTDPMVMTVSWPSWSMAGCRDHSNRSLSQW
jgi:hypothetical protein